MTNVHHLSTNFISHQFHVVFDDLFKTMNSNGVDEPIIEYICQDLFRLNRELYAEIELNEAGILFTSPLPSIRSGLMKLAYDMITKITFNNGIGMKTSCMNANGAVI